MAEEVDHQARGLALLNEAIEELMASAVERGYTCLDAVLVVGAQRLDANGNREGGVGLFMPNGSGPVYAARGLLADAMDRLAQGNPLVCSHCCDHN